MGKGPKWKVHFTQSGKMKIPVNCDVTYDNCKTSKATTKKTIQRDTLKSTINKSRNKPVSKIKAVLYPSALNSAL